MKEVIFKEIPEDFLVEEVPTLRNMSSHSNNKQSKYFLIKRGYSTFDAVDIISSFFSIDPKCITYCGLKDEEGITKQEITVPKNTFSEKKIKSFNSKNLTNGNYINLFYIGESEKLAIGKLQGNDFTVVLRNIDKSFSSFFKTLKKNNFPFINYYDYQRFGIPGFPSVTHLIGKALTHNDYEKAFELYKISGNTDYVETFSTKEDFFLSLDSRKVSFFKNSYSSYIWNEKLNRLITKEIVNFRTDQFQNFSFSFSNEKSSLYNFEKNHSFIDFKKFLGPSKSYSKRNTVIHTNISQSTVQEDEFHPSKIKVTLSFCLPSGCYATMFIRQLCNYASSSTSKK